MSPAPSPGRDLTVTDVAHRPLPGGVTPSKVVFDRNGRHAIVLVAPFGSLVQEGHVVDLTTGERRALVVPGVDVDEGALSLEERLRRERARQLTVGITDVRRAGSADRFVVPMRDGLWIYDDVDAEPRRVVGADDGPLLDAQLSDDGAVLGFVRGGEVWTVGLDGSTGDTNEHGARATPTPVAVTSAAHDGVTNGLAEFIAQEELDRASGYWLSPGGDAVVFCEVDESHIPIYRIVHQGSDDVGDGAYEDHRYPFAGADNAVVRVGVAPTGSTAPEAPVWLDLDATAIGPDRYVARVGWAGRDRVVVQLLDRTQTRLDVVAYDPSTGSGSLLWREESEVWINLHDHLRHLDDGGFLWSSERSGFRHLEVREPDGALRHVLTSGDWVVTSVDAVDDEDVYFTATAATPLERHLYRVRLDGSGEPVPLTTVRGVHQSRVHTGAGVVVDTYSAPDRPPVTVARRLASSTGDAVEPTASDPTASDPTASTETASDPTASAATVSDTVTLHDAGDDPVLAELALRPPEELTVTADDGTTLHGVLYRPDGDGPHPTVVWTYGGPHAQLVTRSWAMTAALRPQFLRQRGFAVAVVDGRGSWDRGLAFEGQLRHRMGTVEVDDQVALVEHLVTAGVADRARVGIYGWSYGGYLSALCLARRPDVFAAACAGAPVTSWDGYDTAYTERYMGTPSGNPDGYAAGSVMTHVEGLRDRPLLLVHGLIDENVHFRHSARLIQAMIDARIDHQLFLFPGERHLPRGEADRAFMEERIVSFFDETLRVHDPAQDNPAQDNPALNSPAQNNPG